MEFSEKLKRLRKEHGMTQESLSRQINISRTAVSKWESGRGFPNIDALKNISRVFKVPVDELLSGDEMRHVDDSSSVSLPPQRRSALYFSLDFSGILLMFLPLYGKLIDGYIYSVNLFHHTDAGYLQIPFFVIASWWIFLGAIGLVCRFFASERVERAAARFSFAHASFIVLSFAATREPYATALVFLILLFKTWILVRPLMKNRA